MSGGVDRKHSQHGDKHRDVAKMFCWILLNAGPMHMITVAGTILRMPWFLLQNMKPWRASYENAMSIKCLSLPVDDEDITPAER